MFGNNMTALAVIILSNIIVLFFIYLLGIKFRKIRVTNIIHMRQYFLTMLSTVILGCLFPTLIAVGLFLILFFLYRMVIFKNDALQLQYVYSKYNGSVHLSPSIKSFSYIFLPYKPMGTEKEPLKREYRYTFSKYINNVIYIFVFYCAKGTARPENTILYGFEFFVAITTLYVVIAKLIYHLSLTTPNSLFFLCPNLSYIPVALVGLMFYGVATLMFMSTL